MLESLGPGIHVDATRSTHPNAVVHQGHSIMETSLLDVRTMRLTTKTTQELSLQCERAHQPVLRISLIQISSSICGTSQNKSVPWWPPLLDPRTQMIQHQPCSRPHVPQRVSQVWSMEATLLLQHIQLMLDLQIACFLWSSFTFSTFIKGIYFVCYLLCKMTNKSTLNN